MTEHASNGHANGHARDSGEAVPPNDASEENEAPAPNDASERAQEAEAPAAAGSPAALEAERRETALRQVAEAVIFAADEPVSAARIAAIFADVTGAVEPAEADVRAAVERLNGIYEAGEHAFRIQHWAGGFRMATQGVMAPFVRALFAGERDKGLSRSLMETLAIVAYRQPVTRPEVEHVRGVSADYAVRKLLEMGLVDVQGRSDSLGRPLLYGTTGHFLEQFGFSSLDDLPTLREVEELLADPSFDRERAQLLTLQRGAAGQLKQNEEDERAEEHDQTEPEVTGSEMPQAGLDADGEASEASHDS